MLHIYCSQVLALHCVLTSNITSGSGVKYFRMQCHQIFRAWLLKTFQETISYITLYYTKYNILRSILSPDITLFFVLKYYRLNFTAKCYIASCNTVKYYKMFIGYSSFRYKDYRSRWSMFSNEICNWNITELWCGTELFHFLPKLFQ